jgi:hypothetical protein
MSSLSERIIRVVDGCVAVQFSFPKVARRKEKRPLLRSESDPVERKDRHG